MSSGSLEILAKRLLDKAKKDLKIANKVINDPEVCELALFHLEQASEKILKAYFIGVIVGSMAFLYELSKHEDRNRYPKPYSLYC